MNKRSIRKNRNLRKPRKQKTKKTKRRVKQKKKTLRKLKGGASINDMNTILLGLLDEKYVTLPTTRCIEDNELLQTYLSSVTASELFSIIGKSDKLIDSNTLNQLIRENEEDNSDLLRELGSLINIPTSHKLLSKFRINCFNLTSERNNNSNVYMKKLHSYILECENHLSIKDVDWYHVALGLQPFDDEFDADILEEIIQRNIFIDTDKFKEGLEELQYDDFTRDVCKQRIINCGNNSQSFTDTLFGSVTWNSYKECFKCSDNSCLVYLDNNYKAFLKHKHNIKTIDKIKILIFMELRLRKLSKYFSVSALRIYDRRIKTVKSLLTKIYNEDYKTNNLTPYSTKPVIMRNNPREYYTGGYLRGGDSNNPSDEETLDSLFIDNALSDNTKSYPEDKTTNENKPANENNPTNENKMSDNSNQSDKIEDNNQNEKMKQLNELDSMYNDMQDTKVPQQPENPEEVKKPEVVTQAEQAEQAEQA